VARKISFNLLKPWFLSCLWSQILLLPVNLRLSSSILPSSMMFVTSLSWGGARFSSAVVGGR